MRPITIERFPDIDGVAGYGDDGIVLRLIVANRPPGHGKQIAPKEVPDSAHLARRVGAADRC